MKKNHWIYILLLVLLIPVESQAQRWRLVRYEASVGIGTTHAFMDIGSEFFGLKSFRLPGTRPNFAFDASFMIIQDLSVQLDLSYIPLSGKDPIDRGRGYSFISHSFEPVVRLEYNIIGDGRTFGFSGVYNRKGMVNNYNKFSLYVFAGAGGILTKSKITDSDGEEVLSNPYYDNNTHFNFVLPAGLGMKYTINSDLALGFEIGYRYTFTDELDGYLHPSSQYNDYYILTNVKAIYKIRNDRRGVPIFRRYGGRR